MGKLEYFKIQLEKPVNEAIYFPGEPLRGALIFKALERFKTNSIYLIIDGTCRVKWHESAGKDRRTYSAKEVYLSEKILFVKENGIIEPGKYTFPFNFTLPLNLPTSFEHKIGRIRYSLNGTIEIPWSPQKHTNMVFTILNELDLNMLPNDLRRPQEKIGYKTFCCGPCKSSPVTGEITLNKTGFVPGEVIKCHAIINNNSSYLLKPTKVALIQQIDFHGDGFTHHIKKERREVVAVQYNRLIEEKTSQECEDIRLLIPPVCSSTTEYNSFSNLIRISYYVVLFIRAANECSPCHFDKELSIPVVVGTRPLIELNSRLIGSNFDADIMANELQVVSPPPYSFQASFFTNEASEDLPPDYEQVVGSGELIQSNSSTFRPFYPYFSGLNNDI